MEDYYSIDRCSNSELGRIKRELMGLLPDIMDKEALHFGKLFHTGLLEPNKFNPADMDVKRQMMLASMIMECKRNPAISHFCSSPDSEFEKELFFDFEGAKFKAKLDIKLHSWIADLKTTAAASREQFLLTFDQYGYWRQAAIYMVGSGAKKFTFFGVQKKMDRPKIFTVNANDYPEKLEEALEEAVLLTEHYNLRRKKNERKTA